MGSIRVLKQERSREKRTRASVHAVESSTRIRTRGDRRLPRPCLDLTPLHQAARVRGQTPDYQHAKHARLHGACASRTCCLCTCMQGLADISAASFDYCLDRAGIRSFALALQDRLAGSVQFPLLWQARVRLPMRLSKELLPHLRPPACSCGAGYTLRSHRSASARPHPRPPSSLLLPVAEWPSRAWRLLRSQDA